VTSNST